MSEKNSGLTSIYTPVLVLLLIVASFFVGRLSSQVSALKNAAPAPTPTQQGAADPQQPAAPTVSLNVIKGLFDKDLIKFGDKNKKVLFVEVSDPSCPYCGAASGLNGALNKQMGPQFTLVADGGTYVAPVAEMKKLLDQNKIGYVWVYSNGHGNGELGAKALYCANEKGKFWDAHSLLFSAAGYDFVNNTVKNDVAKSGEMAKFLAKAVDQNFMNGCLSSDKYKDRLVSDIAEARALGVNGTPGFFVNASNFPGAVSFNDMKSIVDSAFK